MELSERCMTVRYSEFSSGHGQHLSFSFLYNIRSFHTGNSYHCGEIVERCPWHLLVSRRNLFLGCVSVPLPLPLFSSLCWLHLLSSYETPVIPKVLPLNLFLYPLQVISYDLITYIASYMVISPNFFLQHRHLQVREYFIASYWTLLQCPMFPGEPCRHLQR